MSALSIVSGRAAIRSRSSLVFLLSMAGACSGGAPSSSGSLSSGGSLSTGGSLSSGGSFSSGGSPSSGGSSSGGSAGHAPLAGAPGANGGSSGGSGGGSAATGTFSSVAGILEKNCGNIACHGGGPEGRKIVLTNRATLYGTLTSTVIKECNDKTLVVPNDPAGSALLMLMTWKCTDLVMPQGCIEDPCLPSTDLSAISAWISAGAPGP